MAHRRDSNDQLWSQTKLKVWARDKGGCRLFKILTYRESLLFKNIHKNKKSVLQCAHILEASLYPNLIYDVDNIVLLNSISHEYMDRCRHPVTGENITKEERNKWWLRIMGDIQSKKLLNQPDALSYFNEVL